MGFFFSSLDGRKEAKEDQGLTEAGEVDRVHRIIPGCTGSYFDQRGAGGVSATEDAEADKVARAEAFAVLGVDEGGAGRAGIAKFSDVAENLFLGDTVAGGDILEDAHVGLVADEVAEVVERVAVVREQTEGVLRHVGAGLQEDVLAFGHAYAAVAGPKLDAFGAFADGAEGFGVDLQDFGVCVRYAFVGEEKGDGGVAPEVARLGIVLVAVGRVLIAADDERTVGLAHHKIAFDDLERIDKR